VTWLIQFILFNHTLLLSAEKIINFRPELTVNA